MLTDLRAELTKQAHRAANWLLLAVGVLLSLTFGYLIPYAGLDGNASGAPGSDRGLAAMLPEAFVGSALGGMPIFVGALALIFGVLVAGSEYGWQTWKSVFVQQPSRHTVYLAKLAAVGIGVGVGVLALFAGAATASAVVASLQDQSSIWPGFAELARGAGAGWLVAMMWGSLGVFLALAFRAVALPIGLGVVWLLAVQNLLASIAAPLLDWVAQLQKGLPGPNAGALVAALGASTETPGVGSIVGATQATLVVAAYLVVFVVAGGAFLHRRDIA